MLDTEATPEMLVELKPDVVVIATGSAPRPYPGGCRRRFELRWYRDGMFSAGKVKAGESVALMFRGRLFRDAEYRRVPGRPGERR